MSSHLMAACHMPDTNWTALAVVIVAGSPNRLSQPLAKAARFASAVAEANRKASSHCILLLTAVIKCHQRWQEVA
jgi:hypothetical protein